MEKVQLKASKRAKLGRGAARRGRKAGQIPGVVYAAGEVGGIPLCFDDVELRAALRRISGGATIVDLDIDGQKRPALLAECQRDPISDKLIHVDFHGISMKKKMHAHLPVTLVGVDDCVGVKAENGILEFLCHSFEIRCLPGDLPTGCSVDVSQLHVGQIIHVRDLPPIEGVKVLSSPDLVIAACSAMKASQEGTGEAATAAVPGSDKKSDEKSAPSKPAK
ncbi:MAG: 50S ribosomal protein L25 [Puniceicoccales bacterium]|jgi:large subunit ribosomal protein L25|nr:50S ribosomal protein L25 [Puniceicoccales bacterium]